MADFTVIAPNVETVNGTKTILLVQAGTNRKLIIPEFSVSLEAATEYGVTLRLNRVSTNGVGGVSATPRKVNTAELETADFTALAGPASGAWGTAPTEGDTVWSEKINSKFGIYTWVGSHFYEGGFVLNPNERLALILDHPNASQITPRARFTVRQ